MRHRPRLGLVLLAALPALACSSSHQPPPTAVAVSSVGPGIAEEDLLPAEVATVR